MTSDSCAATDDRTHAWGRQSHILPRVAAVWLRVGSGGWSGCGWWLPVSVRLVRSTVKGLPLAGRGAPLHCPVGAIGPVTEVGAPIEPPVTGSGYDRRQVGGVAGCERPTRRWSRSARPADGAGMAGLSRGVSLGPGPGSVRGFLAVADSLSVPALRGAPERRSSRVGCRQLSGAGRALRDAAARVEGVGCRQFAGAGLARLAGAAQVEGVGCLQPAGAGLAWRAGAAQVGVSGAHSLPAMASRGLSKRCGSRMSSADKRPEPGQHAAQARYRSGVSGAAGVFRAARAPVLT